MLQFRVTLLLFYVSITKSLRPLKTLPEDIQPVKTDPVRHDDAIGTKTGVTARRFQNISILDDLENNSGEVFSSELDSNDDDNYRRNGQSYLNFRRNVKPGTKLGQKRMYHSSHSDSKGITSTSFETHEFQREWVKRWDALKEDAFNLQENVSRYPRERFLMVAARPWYMPCGDPDQHDVPWGTCLLSTECEAEYRIYRGDIGCGRTLLVCCAVERFHNDMNAAMDLSFAESSQFSTSSEEAARNARGSKENRRRKKQRSKNLRRLTRRRQKRNLKKTIRKIMSNIKKQLSRAFRNNSRKRTLATFNLKRLVDHMKHKFKRDRRTAIQKNDQELIHISDLFAKKIASMSILNLNFLTNATFREIVVNGSITKKVARQLLEVDPKLSAFPEMKMFIDVPRVIQNNARRSGGRRRKRLKPRRSLQYDIMD